MVPFEPSIMLRAIVLIATLLSAVKADCESSCVDLTRVAGSNGLAVVLATVRLVQTSDLFSDDYGTLRRIAYAETLDGLEATNHGGVWAVSEHVFNTALNTSNSTILNGIQAAFGIVWSDVVYDDLEKPLYSALAARIFLQILQNSGQPVNSVEAQIALWTSDYNTNAMNSSYIEAVENAVTDDDDYITVQLGTKLQLPVSSNTVHLSMPANEPVELDVTVDPSSNKQIVFYASNVPGTSEAVYCSHVKSNSTARLHVASPQQLLPYSSSEIIYMSVVVENADGAAVNLTVHSRVLSETGYQDIGSRSNRFVIGMFSNHPDADYIPITLSISTTELTSVNFTIRSSQGIVMEGSVEPDQATEVLLPDSYVVYNVTDTNKGLMVETVSHTDSISLSVSSHYQYSSDSYLAIPQIDYIGTDLYTYYAVTPHTNTTSTYHRVLLVGGYNATKITITMAADAFISDSIVSGGILSAEQKYTFELSELDTILIESELPLTGSKVESDKPITFISGHQCAIIPESGNSCDFAIEQYPPTLTWGRVFFFPLLSSRMGGSYISLVSSTDNTHADLWCFSNSTNVNITDVIDFTSEGEYFNILVAPDDIYCSIVSNGSLLVTLIATSENLDDVPGDPFMMIIPPMEQFYKNISFVANSAFESSFINVFSTSDSVLFNDSNIEDWVTMKSFNDEQLGYATQIELKDTAAVNELITISSVESLSFAVNFYGFNFSVGYGQVAGMNFFITSEDTIQPFAVNVESIEVIVGDSFQLVCTSSGPTPYSIRWKRNEEFVVPSCKYSITSSSRINSMLVVHNSTFDDNGTYSCVAYSYYTAAVSSYEAAVYVKSVLSVQLIPSIVSVLFLDDELYLYCNISDTTDAVVAFTWTHNNQVINESSSILRITYDNALSAQQGGVYQCTGYPDSDSIIPGHSNKVLIGFAPLITHQPKSILALPGESVNMNCTASGHPVSKLEWFKLTANATNISTIEHVLSLSEGLVFNETNVLDNITSSSSYIFESISYSSHGYYVCVATLTEESLLIVQDCCTNQNTSTHSVIKDYIDISNIALITVSPLNSVKITPSVINSSYSENITFVCTSEGGPNNEYQWTSIRTGAVLSSEPYLVIESVAFSDGGNYECTVTNEAGHGSAVSSLNTPVFIVNGLDDQLVEVGDNVTMTCEFLSHSNVSVVWLHNDDIVDTGVIETTRNSSVLYLYDVDESNTGNYTCEIDNGVLDAVSITAELTVGRITVDLYPIGLTVVEYGESVNLNCSVNANIPLPNSQYTWLLNEESLNDTASFLILNYNDTSVVNKGGIYQCFVANENTTVTGESNAIQIAFGPTVTTQPSVSGNNNGTVQMHCNASGNPVPVIEWYRVPTDIDQTSLDSVLLSSINLPVNSYNDTTVSAHSTSSVLYIDPVHYEDYGYYLCIANLPNNSIVFTSTCCNQVTEGTYYLNEDIYTISKVTTLTISPIGSVTVEPLELTVGYYDDAEFNCSGLGGPDNQFTWTSLTTGDIVSNYSELILEEATFDDSGLYQCTVSNKAGNESAISILNVTLSPLRIISVPENVTVALADDVSLSCVFISELSTSVEWLFNGSPLTFPHQVISTTNMSTLSLSNVNVSNTGMYTCRLDNGVENIINGSGYLTVGTLTITLLPVGVTVIEFGEEQILKCNVSSNINIDIEYTWILNDEPIHETSSVLHITYNDSFSAQHGGVYQCLGSDTDITLSGESNKILIGFAPLITHQPEPTLALPGESVDLNCTATGHPVSILEWFKLTTNATNISTIEQVLSLSEGLVFNETNILDNITSSSSYSFESISYSSHGYYVCVATLTEESLVIVQDCCTNQNTSTHSVIKDYVDISNIALITVSPLNSVKITPSVINSSYSENITFICTSEGGPNNEYQWTSIRTGAVLSSEPYLVIESVAFSDGGNYECTVTNEAGHGSAVSSLNTPVFIVNGPDDQLVEVGDNVTMTCEFLSHSNVSVVWLHNDDIVDTGVIETTRNSSVLYLYDVDESNTGNYTCEIDNGVLDATNVTAELSVGEILVDLYPIGLTVVEYAESVNLSCSVNANIPLSNTQYTWLLNDEPLNDTASFLLLNYSDTFSVNKGGIYQCFVSNNDVTVTGESNAIQIVFGPIVTTQPLVLSNNNSTVQMHCNASGNPVPAIEWYRVPTDIDQTSLDSVLLSSINLPVNSYNDTTISAYSTSSVLFIDPVHYDDYGYYLCIANLPNNSIVFTSTCCNQVTEGTYYLNEDIYAISKATTLAISPIGSVTVEPLELTVGYYDDAEFNCSGLGGPDNQFTWTSLTTGDIVSNYTELILEEATFDDSGLYQCTVSNKAGNESAISILNVTLSPLRIISAPDNVTAAVADDVSLSCVFISELSTSVEWLFNGSPLTFPHQVISTTNMSTLSLSNVNVSNTGMYTCRLDNGVENIINGSGYLTVGTLTITLLPVGVTVIEFGEEQILKCNVSSNINIDIEYTWILNDEPIHETSSVLHITYNDSLSVEQGGVYQCLGSDTDITLSGESNKILIGFAPLITHQPEPTLALPGESVDLNCTATGHPVSILEWFKLTTNATNISTIEQVLSLSEGLVFNETNVLDNITSSSSYSFESISYSSHGYYVCVATLTEESLVIVQDCCTNQNTSTHSVIKDYIDISNIALITVSPLNSVKITPSVINSSYSENITFVCTSEGGPNNEYQWTSIQTGAVLSSEPYLVIESVAFSDGGNYECTVTNEAGHGSAVSTLNTPVFIVNGPDDQLVEVGDNVTMTCDFLSHSNVSVVWLYNDDIVDTGVIETTRNSSVLYLYDVDESNTGNYTCEIDNGVLDATNVTAELTVGEILVDLYPIGLTVVEYGESVNLSCSVNANIPLSNTQYTWLLNDGLLNDTASFLLLNYSDTFSVNKGGIYQCFVSNNDVTVTGESNAIQIAFGPTATTQPSVSSNNNSVVQMHCNASGNPLPVIEWYRVPTNIDQTSLDSVLLSSIDLPDNSYNDTTISAYSTSSVLFIDPVHYDDYGYYLCIANLPNNSIVFTSTCCNQVTEGTYYLNEDIYAISKVTTLAISPIGSVTVEPLELTVGYYDDAEFNCSGLGGPDNQFTWTSLTTGDIVSNYTELILEEATFDDNGLYQCTVSNKAGNESAISILNVTLSPLRIISAPDNVTAAVADDVSLSCVFISELSTSVEWLFNGSPLTFPHQVISTTNMSTLSLSNVNVSNTGMYTCRLDNGVENIINGSGYLTVGTLTITLLPVGITVIEFGEEQILKCNVSSNINIDIEYTWILNDEPIHETSSVLHITYNDSLSAEQGGVYQCLGSDTELILSEQSNKILIGFAPLITHQPESTLALPGESVDMNCTATGHPIGDIEWFKLSNRNISMILDYELDSENSLYNETNRQDNITSTSQLTLNMIDYDDHGFYVCVATLKELILVQDCCHENQSELTGSLSLERSISNIGILTVSPINSVQIYPPVINSSLGGNAIFNCSANGGPDNTYQWSHVRTGNVVHNGSRLTIDSVSYDNSGDYACEVRNEAGFDVASSTLNSQVQLTEGPVDSLVAVGSNVQLTCEFNSLILPIAAQWFYNGDALIDSTSVTTTNNKSTLYLNDITLDQSGSYTCVLNNGILGSANATGVLTIDQIITTISPSGVKILQFEEVLNISCSASLNIASTGKLVYSWMFNYELILNHSLQWLLLQYNTPDAATLGGVYECHVIANDTGFTGQSESLLVVMEPYFTEQPENILTHTNNTVELRCGAVGHPVPMIEWYRVHSMNNISDRITLLEKATLFPYSSLYETSTTNTTRTSLLIIDPVEYEDYGYYLCVASLDNKTVTYVRDCCNDQNTTETFTPIDKLSRISVISVSPVDSVTIDPTNATAELNERATFTCFSMGGPDNSYEWIHIPTGQTVGNDNSTLEILSVEAMYGGGYRCVVSNMAGNESSTSILYVDPYFFTNPSNSTILVNNSITLHCNASGYRISSIIWVFNGSVVTNSSGISIVYSYTSYHTLSSAMTIQSVDLHYHGNYHCLAINTDEEASEVSLSGFVSVVVPPRLVGGLSNITNIATDNTTMSCIFKGFPKPFVTWWHNGSLIGNEGRIEESSVYNDMLIMVSSQLTISSVQLEDQGVYECVAKESIFNNSDSSQGTLTVQVPPTLSAVHSKISEAITHPVTLSFNISEDNPMVLAADIHWFFNGTEITENNTRYSFTNNKQSLTINMLMLSDEGVYTIIASNPAGSDTTQITIDVEVPPVVIQGPISRQVVDGGSINFTCAANAEPTHFVEWDFNGQRIIPDNSKYTILNFTNEWMLIISDILLQDAGVYVCVAINIHGMANASALLEVQVPPSAELLYKNTSLNATAGKELSLNCSSMGYPIPNITWFKDSEIVSETSVTFSTHIISKSSVISNLHIPAPRIYNSGIYHCQSTNTLVQNFSSMSNIVEIQVYSPPNATVELTEVTYNESDTLKLWCEFKGFPEPSIYWTYRKSTTSEPTVLVSGVNRTVIASYDVSLDEEGSGSGIDAEITYYFQQEKEHSPSLQLTLSNSTSYLIISNLVQSDEGYYSCRAENGVDNYINSNQQSEAYVIVQRVPVIFITYSTPVIGVSTRSVTLNVSIKEDNPTVIPSDIIWAFNDKEINGNGHTFMFSQDRKSLTINNLNVSDEGNYTVTASNPAGHDSIAIQIDVQVSPVIINGPDNQAVLEGNTAFFFCQVISEPLHELDWIFGNTTLVNSSQYMINPVNQELTIVNATLSIAGNYTCAVRNTHGNSMNSAVLEVQVSPIVTTHPENRVERIAGQTLHLNCTVSGNPLPSIQWMHNNATFTYKAVEAVDESGLLPRITSILTLNHLNLTNVGSYQCSATTSLVESLSVVSSKSDLAMKHPPEVTTSPEMLVTAFNVMGVIVCKGFGLPPPTLSWSRLIGENTVELSNNSDYSISGSTELNEEGYTVTVLQLTLLSTRKVLEGDYICEGVNNIMNLIGTAEESLATFHIEAAPEVITDQDPVIGFFGYNISITFSVINAAPLVIPDNITWMFNDNSNPLRETNRLTFSENRLTLTISNLIFSDEGSYNVIALNRIGQDSTSLTLTVDEHPVITTISESMNIVSPTEVNIRCTARGKPSPTVQWSFKDKSIGGSITMENDFTFEVMDVGQAGVYTCLAFNKHSSDHGTLELFVQDPPMFVVHPVPTNGTVSDSLTLSCEVYGYPRPNITWYKNGKIINEEEEELGSGGLKYEVTNEGNGNYASSELRIYDLSYEDNGNYYCRAINSLFETRETSSNFGIVDIHYPPDLISGILNQTKNATDTLALYCNFTGTPTPRIDWFSNGALRRETQQLTIDYTKSEDGRIATSLFTLKNLAKSDEGTYTCAGVNHVQNLINANNLSYAFITVQVPPTITPMNDESMVTAVKDYSFTITFVITDDFPTVKPENIFWTFTSDNTGITSTIDNSLLSDSRLTLRFESAQLLDRGNYTIFATNEAGQRNSTVIMDVHVEPKLLNDTGSTKLVNGTGGSITLNCTADGIPRPRILWRRNGVLILNISRTVTITVSDPDSERQIRVEEIQEIEQSSSLLTINNLRTSDTGLYTCRGDNSAGRAAILKTPYNLTVSQFIPPTPRCVKEPNICGVNGRCLDTFAGNFLCICSQGYTGSRCNQEVIVFIPPSIRLTASIGTSATKHSLPVNLPTNATGRLLEPLNLTCIASGNPLPIPVWDKRNSDFNSTGELLEFPELELSQRGYYWCFARNEEGSVMSDLIHLNISNVVQYEIVLDIHNRSFTESGQVIQLVEEISSLFSGGQLEGTDGIFYSVEDDPRAQISFIEESVIVTIISDNGGNPEVLEALVGYMSSVIEDNVPLVSLLTASVDRFDGCTSTNTLIPSFQGNSELDFNVTWPETNLGQIAIIECPCGGLNLSSSALIATRECGGSYELGAVWEKPELSACNFTDDIREICNLANRPADEIVQQLESRTQDASNFSVALVTVTINVLVSATDNISGNNTLTEQFFGTVSNLVRLGEDTLQESQESGNTTAIMLNSVITLTDNIQLTENETELVIPQETFAIRVQAVNTETFTGQEISFAVDPDSGSLQKNESIFDSNADRPPGASLSLPPNLFSRVNTTSSTRITNTIYINDILYGRRETNNKEVGSIIVAATVVGQRIQGLDPPLQLRFARKSSLANGTDPQCVFWDASLDGGFGDWSSEGCMDPVNETSSNETTCHCTHLTSFCMLLDVSPAVNEPPTPRTIDTALEVVTYIGCIVSIFCLVITVVSYLANKKLRSSEHGLLLLNLSFSLIGLYATFILALHSKFNVGFCAFIGAMLQYFFLTTFLIMGAEAINLYMKLVVVLGSNIHKFVLKVCIFCWVFPVFIVLFTFAPSYKHYVSDHFCRAFDVPFYIGVIVPFILIYIFNWIIFAIILTHLIYKAKRSSVKDMKEQKKKMQIKQQFIIAITLSILFGLGWGIGLPATQKLQDTVAVRDTFASLFVLLTSFQGLFVFFMHCLRSQDIRKQWMRWFKISTKQTTTNTSVSGTSKRKTSDVTKTTSAASKVSDRYRSAKKHIDDKSSTSVGDEFSFVSDGDDGMSTLKRNVEKSGIMDKDTTLKRFGQDNNIPRVDYLPFIEEDEQEEQNMYGSNNSLSSDDVYTSHKNAPTYALPEGVIGNEDFDIDAQSIGRFSAISDVKGNMIFSNPLEMQNLDHGDPFAFADDTMSYASVYSENETSQTVFINPLEDTV